MHLSKFHRFFKNFLSFKVNQIPQYFCFTLISTLIINLSQISHVETYYNFYENKTKERSIQNMCSFMLKVNKNIEFMGMKLECKWHNTCRVFLKIWLILFSCIVKINLRLFIYIVINSNILKKFCSLCCPWQ